MKIPLPIIDPTTIVTPSKRLKPRTSDLGLFSLCAAGSTVLSWGIWISSDFRSNWVPRFLPARLSRFKRSGFRKLILAYNGAKQ
jgi:hypothetical protein